LAIEPSVAAGVNTTMIQISEDIIIDTHVEPAGTEASGSGGDAQ